LLDIFFPPYNLARCVASFAGILLMIDGRTGGRLASVLTDCSKLRADPHLPGFNKKTDLEGARSGTFWAIRERVDGLR
jgi:hypothetical protein